LNQRPQQGIGNPERQGEKQQTFDAGQTGLDPKAQLQAGIAQRQKLPQKHRKIESHGTEQPA
jgi:hypothetical protein